jgi:hypothetical protein
MKRIFLLYLMLVFPLIFWAQPPQSKKETNVQMNAGNYNMQMNQSTENGLLNNAPESEENTLIKADSTYFKLKSIEQEDLYKLEERSSVDQQTQTFRSFSVVRQKSKMNSFQRTPMQAEQMEMDAKVMQLKQLAPNSWEYPLAYYSAGNYNLDRGAAIQQAFELNSENSDIQKQYFSFQYISGDTLNAANTLSTMTLDGSIGLDVERYTSDVLLSCSANSTLITHGFEDSYGCLFNQFNHQQSTDVRIISLDFMQSPQYRAEMSRLGYKLPKSTKIDVAYLNQFCFLNADKNIHLSMTLPRTYLEQMSKKLYPSGLTFQYADSQPIDLPERQQNLWFYQLTKYGLNEGEQKTKFAPNYLPMLYMLLRKYENEGDENQLRQIRESINRIQVKQINKKAGN